MKDRIPRKTKKTLKRVDVGGTIVYVPKFGSSEVKRAKAWILKNRG
jgi:hypothetical protein